jgi:hypothetical protein
MALGAYFLSGVADDHILVFRSDDAEDLLRIITRLAASRDKEIRSLAQQLELQWFERQYNKENKTNDKSARISRRSRSEDREENQDGSGD